MFSELTRALVETISRHRSEIVAGSLSIGGTLAGAVGQFLIDRWRQRGEVAFDPVGIHLRYEGSMPFEVRTIEDLELGSQVHFDFELRASNSFPIPKSVGLISVEFFPMQPRWWRRKMKKMTPLLSDPFLTIGTVFGDLGRTDIQVPAQSFIRIYLSGAGVADTQSDSELVRALRDFRSVRIVFLVSPNKKVVFWHTFTAAEMNKGEKSKVRITEI